MNILKRFADTYYDECKDCIWSDYKEDEIRVCPERRKKCTNFIDRRKLPQKPAEKPSTID